MALSKESIRKLRMVKECILAEPNLYDQNDFPDITHTCLTPCCIAGWAAWVNNPSPSAYRKRLKEKGFLEVDTMQDDLGITKDQAHLLFSDWPNVGDAWRYPGTMEAAEDAARRIELFIQSGGTK